MKNLTSNMIVILMVLVVRVNYINGMPLDPIGIAQTKAQKSTVKNIGWSAWRSFTKKTSGSVDYSYKREIEYTTRSTKGGREYVETLRHDTPLFSFRVRNLFDHGVHMRWQVTYKIKGKIKTEENNQFIPAKCYADANIFPISADSIVSIKAVWINHTNIKERLC